MLQKQVLMTDLEKLVTFYHLHRMPSRRHLPASSSNHQHSMMTILKILLPVTLVLKKILIWLHFILSLSDIIISLLTDSENNDQVIERIRALRIDQKIYPHGINLPSSRPQWRLISLFLVHIFAAGRAVSSHSFSFLNS